LQAAQDLPAESNVRRRNIHRSTDKDGGVAAPGFVAAPAAPRRHDICHMMTTTKQPKRQTVAIAFVVQGHDYAQDSAQAQKKKENKLENLRADDDAD